MMWLIDWFRSVRVGRFGPSPARRRCPVARPPAGSRRPHLEALEDRFTPAGGLLDPTFGSGGVVTRFFSCLSMEVAYDVLVQPDGKIVTAGRVQNDFLVARYNANGSLDTSF